MLLEKWLKLLQLPTYPRDLQGLMVAELILPREGQLMSEQGMQRDSREAQVALELQKDGLILCYDSLGASHPLCKCGLGSCK